MSKLSGVAFIVFFIVVSIAVAWGVNELLKWDCTNSGGEWIEKSWIVQLCVYSEWEQTQECFHNGVAVNCSEIGIPEMIIRVT